MRLAVLLFLSWLGSTYAACGDSQGFDSISNTCKECGELPEYQSCMQDAFYDETRIYTNCGRGRAFGRCTQSYCVWDGACKHCLQLNDTQACIFDQQLGRNVPVTVGDETREGAYQCQLLGPEGKCSTLKKIAGCRDPDACNYDPSATVDATCHKPSHSCQACNGTSVYDVRDQTPWLEKLGNNYYSRTLDSLSPVTCASGVVTECNHRAQYFNGTECQWIYTGSTNDWTFHYLDVTSPLKYYQSTASDEERAAYQALNPPYTSSLYTPTDFKTRSEYTYSHKATFPLSMSLTYTTDFWDTEHTVTKTFDLVPMTFGESTWEKKGIQIDENNWISEFFLYTRTTQPYDTPVEFTSTIEPCESGCVEDAVYHDNYIYSNTYDPYCPEDCDVCDGPDTCIQAVYVDTRPEYDENSTCPMGCATCPNGVCNETIQGYHLLGSTVYMDGMGPNGLCENNCDACDETSCLKWALGHFGSGVCDHCRQCDASGVCSLYESGYYEDAQGKAAACVVGCHECNDAYTCEVAKAGYYILNGVVKRERAGCPALCKRCDGTTCLQLMDGFRYVYSSGFAGDIPFEAPYAIDDDSWLEGGLVHTVDRQRILMEGLLFRDDEYLVGVENSEADDITVKTWSESYHQVRTPDLSGTRSRNPSLTQSNIHRGVVHILERFENYPEAVRLMAASRELDATVLSTYDLTIENVTDVYRSIVEENDFVTIHSNVGWFTSAADCVYPYPKSGNHTCGVCAEDEFVQGGDTCVNISQYLGVKTGSGWFYVKDGFTVPCMGTNVSNGTACNSCEEHELFYNFSSASRAFPDSFYDSDAYIDFDSSMFNTVKKCVSCRDGEFRVGEGILPPGSCRMYGGTSGHLACGLNLDNVCFACPTGTYESEHTCFDCPVGYYNDQKRQTTCTLCGNGTVCPETAMVEPEPCEDDRVVFDGILRVSCGNCLAGEEMVDGVCEPCADGMYNPMRGGVCVACDAGFASTTNKTFCSSCIAGKFSSVQSSTCVDCPAGFFSELELSPGCSQCDYGTTNGKAGSADEDECVPCPPSQVVGSDFTCVACDPSLQVQIGGKCVDCGEGEHIENNRCVRCPAGQFITEDSDKRFGCIPCDKDNLGLAVTSNTMRTACYTTCAPNHEVVDGVCEKCPVGLYATRSAVPQDALDMPNLYPKTTFIQVCDAYRTGFQYNPMFNQLKPNYDSNTIERGSESEQDFINKVFDACDECRGVWLSTDMQTGGVVKYYENAVTWSVLPTITLFENNICVRECDVDEYLTDYGCCVPCTKDLQYIELNVCKTCTREHYYKGACLSHPLTYNRDDLGYPFDLVCLMGTYGHNALVAPQIQTGCELEIGDVCLRANPGYRLSDNKPVACPHGCKICTETECKVAFDNFELVTTAFFKCEEGCKRCDDTTCFEPMDGYRVDNGLPIPCTAGCKTCTADTCLSISDGYMMIDGVPQACTYGCSCNQTESCKVILDGYRPMEYTMVDALACHGSLYYKTLWENGKYKNQEYCGYQTPDIFYTVVHKYRGMEPCDEGCARCIGVRCLEAKPGFFLPKGGQGTWGGRLVYRRCDEGCIQCDDSGCNEWEPGYVKNEQYLLRIAPDDGYRLEGRRQIPCDYHCKRCDATTCLEPEVGYRLENSQPVACESGCKQCNATTCLDTPCHTFDANGQCIRANPGYRLSITGELVACQENCVACNQHTCTRAADGYGLYNYTCEECDDLYDSTRRECITQNQLMHSSRRLSTAGIPDFYTQYEFKCDGDNEYEVDGKYCTRCPHNPTSSRCVPDTSNDHIPWFSVRPKTQLEKDREARSSNTPIISPGFGSNPEEVARDKKNAETQQSFLQKKLGSLRVESNGTNTVQIQEIQDRLARVNNTVNRLEALENMIDTNKEDFEDKQRQLNAAPGNTGETMPTQTVRKKFTGFIVSFNTINAAIVEEHQNRHRSSEISQVVNEKITDEFLAKPIGPVQAPLDSPSETPVLAEQESETPVLAEQKKLSKQARFMRKTPRLMRSIRL